MKDSVGSSLLVYLIIIIVGIVGACVIASSAYSKAYKAKTNIISIIDRYYLVNTDTKNVDDNTDTKDEVDNTTDIVADCFKDETCKTTIKNTLDNMGYHMPKTPNPCEGRNIRNKIGEVPLIYPTSTEDFYGYCIYKNEVNATNYYYIVVTFSHLNINVLGIETLFKTPVYGETRVYYDY